ncbi:DNA-directed RNA polymerase subunit omega [Micromonospora sp. NPDC048930]|uniref:DNA-directed RNA polymerase subunit omega n=1 Tax=Micromonospora sp. NPDC048930 TaxID=3364261 RepID=UPI003714E479
MTAATEPREITYPPIDELLDMTSSKYAVAVIAAKRARQINAYYQAAGEGLLEYVGPMVETVPHEKPLSVALRELHAGLLEVTPAEEQPPLTLSSGVHGEGA